MILFDVFLMFSVTPDLTTDAIGSAIGQTVIYGGPAVGSLYLIVRVVLGTQDKALQNTTKRLTAHEERIVTLEDAASKLREAAVLAAGKEMDLNREINRLQIALDRRDATIERLEQEVSTTKKVVRGMVDVGDLSDEQVGRLLPEEPPGE